MNARERLVGKYGTNTPEAYPPDHPNFLKPIYILTGKWRREAYLVSPPAEPIIKEGPYAGIGGGDCVVEEKGPSGWFYQGMIHIHQIFEREE